MAINFTTFFTDAGLAFNAGNVNNTAAATTVPDEVEDYVQGVTGSIDIHKAVDRVPGAISPYQSAAASLNDTVIRQSIRNLLVQMIKDDKPQPSLTVSDAIEQLITQMNAAQPIETVDKSVATCTQSYGGESTYTGTDDTSAGAAFMTDTTASFRVNGLVGLIIENTTDSSTGTITANTGTTVTATMSSGTWDSADGYSIHKASVGDGVIVCSTKRGDGKANEHILAEIIEGTVSSTATDGTGTIELQGEFLASSKMAVDWPKGSAVSSTITSGAASGTNLINGTFEEEDDESADLPLGWIAETADVGARLKLTNVEVTTVVMSGSPSAGFYTLTFTDRDGDAQTTVPLAYNATSSVVQTALTALTGLASVTVVESGTTPNLTHTITMTDVPSSYDSGSPASMFSSDDTEMTGGTITTAAPITPGSPNVIRGARALEFDSDGIENTRIVFPLTSLVAGQQLAFNMWLMADVVPAAGAINVALVDGIGGAAIADDEGITNSFATAFGDWTTSFVAYSGVFRVPTPLPPVMYLRVHIATDISAGTSIFFDEMILKEMDQLYSGGPSVAAFSGRTDWALTDTATVTTTNDRGGVAGKSLNEWMNRVFDLDTNNLLLPSSATPTQDGPTLIV